MTRKLFVRIAGILYQNKPEVTCKGYKKLVEDFADMCEESNHKFDRGRFIDACMGF